MTFLESSNFQVTDYLTRTPTWTSKHQRQQAVPALLRFSTPCVCVFASHPSHCTASDLLLLKLLEFLRRDVPVSSTLAQLESFRLVPISFLAIYSQTTFINRFLSSEQCFKEFLVWLLAWSFWKKWRVFFFTPTLRQVTLDNLKPFFLRRTRLGTRGRINQPVNKKRLHFLMSSSYRSFWLQSASSTLPRFTVQLLCSTHLYCLIS